MLVPFPLLLLLCLPVMVHLVLLFGSVIRRPAVAGRERGTRDAMAASWFGYDGAEHWELQWDLSFMRLGHSQYGVTGFARVISRSSGGPVPVEPIRAHLCRHNPCKADWKHDSKYGKGIPRPIHFQSWSPNAHRAIPAPVPPPQPNPHHLRYNEAVRTFNEALKAKSQQDGGEQPSNRAATRDFPSPPGRLFVDDASSSQPLLAADGTDVMCAWSFFARFMHHLQLQLANRSQNRIPLAFVSVVEDLNSPFFA